MTEGFGLKNALLPALSLFASAGTLVCCALPALLVTLGMGAALAGLVGNVPQIVWLSEYKGLVFGVAALLLSAAGFVQYRSRNLPCPADPAQAKACARLRRVSWWIYGFSVFCFATGFFFAFIAPYLLEK